MSIWGHVFAAMYDRMVGKTERAGLGEHRRALLAGQPVTCSRSEAAPARTSSTTETACGR